MNERTKVVVLIVLVVALAAAMVFAFVGRPGKRKPTERRGRKAKAAEQATAPRPLPTPEEFEEVAEWLAPDRVGIQATTTEGRSAFGLPAFALGDTNGEETRTTAAVPLTSPFVTKPPKLQGIFSIGGQPVALIEGQSYRAGQTIGNTRFKVVEIKSSAVTLRSSRGDEIILDLLK